MGEISRLYAKTPDVQKSNSVIRIQRTKSSQPIKSPADRILFLQRTIGNQAVQRLIRSGTLQAKLRIGQPRDMYEQEADRVADAVMRMPEMGVQREVEPEEEEEETLQSKPLANQITPLVQIQRQEEPEEEEEMLQTKPLAEEITPLVQKQVEPEEEEEVLQTRKISGENTDITPDLESKIQAIRGGGQPLPEYERAFFEPRFGRDFGDVRVHSDAQAAESARAVNAQAFTVGRDVVFGAGQYAPRTTNGKRLVAHELTHVMQQESGQPKNLQKLVEMKEVGVANNKTEETPNQIVAMENGTVALMKEPVKKKKPVKNLCSRTILAEGTCEFLALNSKWVCCDPKNGFKRPGKKTSVAEPKKKCPSEKWSPLFTCDTNCTNALKKGCDDDDSWMAIPSRQFNRSKCGDVYTICANGKQTTGYVRDNSHTKTRYEVSPGIQKTLGVAVGQSFKGAIYRPGAKKGIINKDPCCKS